MLKCPVCNFEPITPFLTVCPGCKADLTPFVMMNELEEKYVATLKLRIATDGELLLQKKRHEQLHRKYKSNLSRTIFLFCLLPLGYFMCRKSPSTDPTLSIRLQERNEQLQAVRAERDSLLAQKVRTIEYTIQSNDNLEKLGQLFFNNPQAGYQIGKENGIERDFYYKHLDVGKKLKINFR